MTNSKMPTWFIVVSVIALLWNLLGVFNFYNDYTITPEEVAALSEEMQPFYKDIPMWNWIAYGTATITGLLGSICLLMKKRWAHLLFIISFLGILVTNYFSFFVSDAMSAIGWEAFVVPFFVISIGLILLIWSKKAIIKGWLT